MQTDLKLSICGFPPMSARNCSQELYPISGGAFYRDVNNNLVFIGNKNFNKYKTVITGKDVNPPAFSGICIGSVIDVECIQYIWKRVDAQSNKIELEKKTVDGSIIVVDKYNNYIDFSINDNVVSIIKPCECFVGFRPCLTMSVIDFSIETDEWGLSTKWKLVMEEI